MYFAESRLQLFMFLVLQQHSTSLYLILHSCSFSPEEPLSHLVWYEPQAVAHRPKLPANAFIQFTTFFLKEKGNSCLSKDHSQTAGRRLGAGSQAAAAARSGQDPPAAACARPLTGLGQDARRPCLDKDPQIARVSPCAVHTSLWLAQAFPERSSES